MTERKMNRTCGGCTECCKTHPIPETKSPAGERCPLAIIGKGCSIYGNHPLGCRLYKCVWLGGKGEDQDKPNLLKIVMGAGEIEIDGNSIAMLDLWESEPKASRQPRVQAHIDANLAIGNAVRIRHMVEKMISPTGIVDQYFFPKTMSTKDKKAFVKKAHKGDFNENKDDMFTQ